MTHIGVVRTIEQLLGIWDQVRESLPGTVVIKEVRRMPNGKSDVYITKLCKFLRSGITRESLVRFERGQVSEFGSRKLLAVLAVLGLEMSFTEVGASGTLDELRRERGGA